MEDFTVGVGGGVDIRRVQLGGGCKHVVVEIVPSHVTMETTPGDRMMSQLDRWVEVISGEFKSQSVTDYGRLEPWGQIRGIG